MSILYVWIWKNACESMGNMKYIVGVVAVVLLAIIGYYTWQAYGSGGQAPLPEPSPEEVVMAKYATSTFSIEYPNTFSVNDAYAYEGVPNKPISGVKFTVPSTMTTGTNLASDSGVSVEWLPRASTCTGDIYVLQNVKAFDMTVGTTTYSVATTTEGAAGNIYEELVYAIPGSSPCTAVRYFIHSSNYQNYFPEEGEPAEIKEFDRAALLKTFDSIRNSLVLTQ